MNEPYKMLMWSTDNDGRVIALINGKQYTHDETVSLSRELSRLVAEAQERIEPGSMVEHITRLRRAGQLPAA